MGDVAVTVTPFELVGATVDEVFWDLVCSDEELLRCEFGAIVAAGYPARTRPERPLLPPRPGSGAPGPLHQEPAAPRPVDPEQRVPPARQRDPPRRGEAGPG